MNSYGDCLVLEEGFNWPEDFKPLIKYHGGFMRIGKSVKYVVIGKDIITGTTLYKEDFENPMYINTSLSQAARFGHLRRGKLIMVVHHQLSRSEVLERLKNMTPEDIQKYTDRINNIKTQYKEARRKARMNTRADIIDEAKTVRQLFKEKGRVRKMAKGA